MKHISVRFGVKDLEHLAAVGIGVALELLPVQGLAREVPAAGISDEAGEVSDEEHHVMTEPLKLAHLVEQHGVSEVEIGRGGIESGLDPQHFPSLEPGHEILLHENLVHAVADDRERVVERSQGSPRDAAKSARGYHSLCRTPP